MFNWVLNASLKKSPKLTNFFSSFSRLLTDKSILEALLTVAPQIGVRWVTLDN